MDMGRGEERVRCMERVTWKLTLPCELDNQREFAVWLKKLKHGLCINLEGWDGEEDGSFKKEGIYVYLWLIHADRKQQNSVKKLSFNKK